MSHTPIPPGSEFLPQGGEGAEGPHDGPGHEMRDTSIRGILWFAGVLAVTAVAIHLGLAAWMGAFRSEEEQVARSRPELFEFESGQYAGPELPDSPNRDKPELVRAQYQLLESYGWIEPGKVARIPVERAMDLALERGLPGASAPPPAGTTTPAAPPAEAKAPAEGGSE